MALGVYGKHSARGDFLEHGLPDGLRRDLEDWLDTALADARTDLGVEWDACWSDAPPLRFWIGESIWHLPVAGVMAPAQDKVGRDFPLVIVSSGDVPPPPAVDPVQNWYDLAAAHLGAILKRTELDGPADLVGGLVPPDTSAETAPVDSADFWAVCADADLAGLWADVAGTDHRRAAAPIVGRAAICGQSAPVARPVDNPDPADWRGPRAAA